MSPPDERKAFQDHYPAATQHCYGCGARNPDGYRIRSFAEGDEAFSPLDQVSDSEERFGSYERLTADPRFRYTNGRRRLKVQPT